MKAIEDIGVILREAEKHGTLHTLKRVPISFDELELRAIVRMRDVLVQIADGDAFHDGVAKFVAMAKDALTNG